MASLKVVRSGITFDRLAQSQVSVVRIQKRLKAGARPVWPVVQYFAKQIKKSVDFDFKVGGRTPFVWAPNRPNTIAGKGHARQLVGKHGNKMQRGMGYQPNDLGGGNYEINVTSPFPGELMQSGAKGPWTIRPKHGRFLRFFVAESRGEYLGKRRRAQKARAAGKKVTVPAGPGAKMVFARFVRHPGYPARKFVVIRDGLLREGWRLPLQAYLFSGKVPR